MSFVRVAARDEMRRDRVIVLRLSPDDLGRSREALVLLDRTGEVRAYVNRCEHLPIPLDGGSRSFFDPYGEHLRCGTHGALYRLEDGFCVAGPCEGRSLLALPVQIDADGFVTVDVGLP
jgi:nitrite reductase/ring-hydroxylating ferredoxin subunit